MQTITNDTKIQAQAVCFRWNSKLSHILLNCHFILGTGTKVGVVVHWGMPTSEKLSALVPKKISARSSHISGISKAQSSHKCDKESFPVAWGFLCQQSRHYFADSSIAFYFQLCLFWCSLLSFFYRKRPRLHLTKFSFPPSSPQISAQPKSYFTLQLSILRSQQDSFAIVGLQFQWNPL